MLNFKVKMKYLINFQVEIMINSKIANTIRSTYTVLDNEVKNLPSNDFDTIKNWFIKYFEENDLDNFVDISNLEKNYIVNLKVGRITNTLDGKYKTF